MSGKFYSLFSEFKIDWPWYYVVVGDETEIYTNDGYAGTTEYDKGNFKFTKDKFPIHEKYYEELRRLLIKRIFEGRLK